MTLLDAHTIAPQTQIEADLCIVGADRLVDGQGNMQWKRLGLLPIVQASRADVARSGAGRAQGEAVWLPSVLCQPEIDWTALNDSQVQADFTAFGEPAHLTLTLNAQGEIQQVALRRWGNPGATTTTAPLTSSPKPAAPLRATPFLPAFGRGGSLAPTALKARAISSAAPLTRPSITDRSSSLPFF